MFEFQKDSVDKKLKFITALLSTLIYSCQKKLKICLKNCKSSFSMLNRITDCYHFKMIFTNSIKRLLKAIKVFPPKFIFYFWDWQKKRSLLALNKKAKRYT